MPDIKWSSQLSLGNILTIVTMLLALATGWQAMKSEVLAQVGRLDRAEARIAAVEQTQRQAAADLADQRLQLAQTLADIRADLRVIRADLERWSQDVRRPQPAPAPTGRTPSP